MRTFTALVVVALVGVVTSPVLGFGLGTHRAILKDALDDGNTLSTGSLFLVTVGNLETDTHQASPEKHFDGAKHPNEICALWKSGLDAALKRAVDLAAPEGPEKRQLKDRVGALRAFGEATHSLADFYSHTNWVELHTASTAPMAIPEAPILGQTCEPSAFRIDLQSGYFSLFYGIDGCPSGGPPRGYRYCHSQIAKDEPDSGHGKDKIGASSVTHHEAAKAVSTKATRTAWRALHDRIVARYETDATDAECLFMKLAWDGNRSCHRKWRAEGRIKTHQEYAIPGGRLFHELTLNQLTISFHSQTVEYPGPNSPPVYADVRGTTRQRGTFCQWAVTRNGTTPKQCQPYTSDTVGSDDGRIKVTPNSDPIELDWRVTFPGKKPKCSGPQIVRLDPAAPTQQPFLNCPGGAPGLAPVRLTYSGSFVVSPE